MSEDSHAIVINGRYRLEDHLGSGGMGSVYRAVDTVLGRPVAVKRCQFHGPGGRKLLAHEARAQARLLHPNIVTVFDFGYDLDGEAFIVMEYFEGGSVQHLMG